MTQRTATSVVLKVDITTTAGESRTRYYGRSSRTSRRRHHGRNRILT